MPVYPLKAWLFSEWWMPVALTGVSTSFVNISAGGAGHYHIVSDHSRPVENCADWTTRKSGAFPLLNSGSRSVIVQLLAGNCLPYHQSSCPTTNTPTRV